MLDYLAIGHIAQDLTPSGYRLGGTAAYAALTAHALGLHTGILTSVSAEADLTDLKALALQIVPSATSTIFENIYTPAGRVQKVHAQAQRLTVETVPPSWQSSRLVHFGPIINEIDPQLADHFRDSFIGLTPQGWMRRLDETGQVYRGEWVDAERLLRLASATVISIEDVAGDWAVVEQWASFSKVFVVTQGEQGATVYSRGERHQVAAPTVPVVDATGAGDIFAAAFFVRLSQSSDPLEAARFAVAIASDSVTRVGIAGVPKAVK
jgi:sugar/nucleoside kinase (ribokinase family)